MAMSTLLSYQKGVIQGPVDYYDHITLYITVYRPIYKAFYYVVGPFVLYKLGHVAYIKRAPLSPPNTHITINLQHLKCQVYSFLYTAQMGE